MIDACTIEAIKAAADLRDIILPELNNPKQQHNGSFKACCPFHQEKEPSFFVHQNYFICFGCGKKGDVYTWYELKHGLDFPEAAIEIGKSVGIPVGFEDEEKIRNWHKFIQTLQAKVEGFMESLWVNESVLDTLMNERNINDSTIAFFSLGYSQKDNAISIPFYDSSMRLNNIAYRTLNADKRYFYDTDVRDAGNKGLIKKWDGAAYWFNELALINCNGNPVYVTEGLFDTMTLHQQGLSAIGYHGSKISDQQIRKLRNVKPSKVIYAPDNKSDNDIDLGFDASQVLKDNLTCPVKVIWPDGDVNATKNLDEMIAAEQSSEIAFLSIVFRGDIEQQRIKGRAYVKKITDPLAKDDIVNILAKEWGKPKNLVENFLNIEKIDRKVITVSEAIDRLEELAYRKAIGQCIKHPDLGFAFEPLNMEHLVAIAARTSVGKTNFAINLMTNIQPPAQVLFCSLEQPVSEIMARTIAVLSEVHGEILNPRDIKKLVTEDEPPGKWNYIKEITKELLPNVHFYDGGMDTKKLRDLIRITKDMVGPNLIVFIDYLGLLRTERFYRNEYEKVTHLAYDIQAAAKETGSMIIFTQQLSRAAGAGDTEVSMDMMRGSGVLEEVSDLLLGLWLNGKEHTQLDILTPIRIQVLKNRHGPSGGWFDYILDKRNLTMKPANSPVFIGEAV